MKTVSVNEATHVKIDGKIERIASKWGVHGNYLQPPSKGGFGVVTESGRRVTMWQAEAYFVED